MRYYVAGYRHPFFEHCPRSNAVPLLPSSVSQVD
jgi:hypothetical protein